jgi:hypothetical protein
MDHHPFTAEPLQESKNTSLTSSLGDRAELWFSLIPKEGFLDLLISSKISKKLGIKQIDAGGISHQGVILWEIKSCLHGEELALKRAITPREKQKWKKTALILSELLQVKVVVRVVVLKYQNGFNFVKNVKLV